LEIDTAKAILHIGRGEGIGIRKANLDAYFEVILKANPKTFLEVLSMADGRMTFEEVFTEAGIIPQWIEQGIEKGIEKGIEQGREDKALEIAQNLLNKNWTFEEIADITKMPVEKVRGLVSK